VNLPEIVIRQPRKPWLRVAWVAGLSALAVVMVWLAVVAARFAFEDDAERTRRDLASLREARKTLNQSLRAVRAENETLREELAFQRQTQEIETQASELLETQLQEQQREILALREQLAFYRGIVSPDVARAGIRVHSLRLSRVGDSAQFRYELVLAQAVRQRRTASGQWALTIEGVEQGRPATRDWPTLAGADAPVRFNFQYFQEFDGLIKLPPGFVPERIRVQLTPEGASSATTEIWDWRRVAASESPAE
jgi:TolA-binding protein